MLVKVYAHSSKETNRDIGEQVGLTGDALSNFKYTAYEVELVYNIDPKTGYGELISICTYGKEYKVHSTED